MNKEVKNEATEEEVTPVIKYENAEGKEVEIPESELSEVEKGLVNDLKNIHEALRSHDDTHKQGLLRQSLTLNINLLTDRLQKEFAKRDEEKPVIISGTKTIES
tara:strand:- start:198 stop:509 length:312 start_codon:yes stop_codon:yes gene_type:complete